MKIIAICLISITFFMILVIGCRRTEYSDTKSITGCTLTWTHPKVINNPPVQIADAKVVE